MNTLLLLSVLVAIVALLMAVLRRAVRNTPVNTPKICENTGEICCGGGSNCFHKQLRRKPATIVYFDDEELDQYANRDPQTYTRQEEACFAEVFDTLRAEETQEWLTSLSCRKIVPPPHILQLAAQRIATSNEQ